MPAVVEASGAGGDVAGDNAGREGVSVHPGQTTVENGDSSLMVRFKAGGIEEMCWHLVTWGGSVTVERPAVFHRRLAEMYAALAAHHRAECSDQETRS